MTKSILERGVSHPQIHVDYYAWLEFVKNGEYATKLIGKVGFQNFHTIAMWAFSQSRETLKEKAQ